MTHNVTLVPSQRTFQVDEGESILAAGLRQGMALPYGCRDGACGACKGRILEGRVDFGKAQEGPLPEAERRAGFALFCCANPQTDLVVECREIGGLKDFPVKTLPARVERMRRLAPDVMLLELRLPANDRLQYAAGQYVDILLKDGRRRSFSIANAPHDDALMQLHVRHVPGGHFTDHVFGTMKERDILRIKAPLGSFFLREESTRPIVLVAGGTGFAPIKALVEHTLHAGMARPMTLYWGARSRRDLYLPELPLAWAASHAHFRYVPVLSDPGPDDGWDGRTGLVHRAVMADLPDLSGHQVYACGAPAMIDAARADFTARCGLPEGEFFADSFTFSGDSVPA